MIDFKDSTHTGSVELEFGDKLKDQFRTSFTVSNLVIIFFKIAFIFVAPVVLFAYEKYNLNRLETAFNQVNGELEVKNTELQKIKKEISIYAGSQERRKDFENRLEILKEMAKERINIIKVLDSIQNQHWF